MTSPRDAPKEVLAESLPDFARVPHRSKAKYRYEQVPGYAIISGGMTSSAFLTYALLRSYEAPGFEPGVSVFEGPWFGNVGKLMMTLAFVFGLKHILQYVFISTAVYDYSFAFYGAIIHICVDCGSAYAYISRVQSGKMTSESGLRQYIALIILLVATVAELSMEWNRKKWKQDPRNSGKVYGEGVFTICRHPNFLCFALYRILGNPLASGSWIPMAIMMTWIGTYYPTKGIRELEQYMDWKYGKQWEAYCKRVQWQLIPFIW